jgi:hypothetical protein
VGSVDVTRDLEVRARLKRVALELDMLKKTMVNFG